MRTIGLICGLVMLVGCQQATEEAKKTAEAQKGPKGPTIPPLTNDDSSPIIISDGSVKMNQKDHFRIHRKKDGPSGPSGPGAPAASIKLGGHAPTTVGYQCDPGTVAAPGNCGAACDPAAIVSKCTVPLSGLNSWSLDLSDSTGVVANLNWDNGKPEKIRVQLPKGYDIQGKGEGSTISGVSLLPSTKSLTSSQLTVNGNGAVYKFACASGQVCLTVGYYCPGTAGPCE